MTKRTVFAAALACSILAAMPLAQAQTMTASWYGINDGSGPTTASGLPFHPTKQHIVAHLTLPFGTCLVLTNPKNGRSDIVTVQDRGPHIRGRQLDVTYAVANKLGFQGVQDLEVRDCTKAEREQIA